MMNPQMDQTRVRETCDKLQNNNQAGRKTAVKLRI
jgi:hypothetical protein